MFSYFFEKVKVAFTPPKASGSTICNQVQEGDRNDSQSNLTRPRKRAFDESRDGIDEVVLINNSAPTNIKSCGESFPKKKRLPGILDSPWISRMSQWVRQKTSLTKPDNVLSDAAMMMPTAHYSYPHAINVPNRAIFTQGMHPAHYSAYDTSSKPVVYHRPPKKMSIAVRESIRLDEKYKYAKLLKNLGAVKRSSAPNQRKNHLSNEPVIDLTDSIAVTVPSHSFELSVKPTYCFQESVACRGEGNFCSFSTCSVASPSFTSSPVTLSGYQLLSGETKPDSFFLPAIPLSRTPICSVKAQDATTIRKERIMNESNTKSITNSSLHTPKPSRFLSQGKNEPENPLKDTFNSITPQNRRIKRPDPESPLIREFDELWKTEKSRSDYGDNFFIMKRDTLTDIESKKLRLKEAQLLIKSTKERRLDWEKELEKRIRNSIKESCRVPGVVEVSYSEDDEFGIPEENEFPELNDVALQVVNDILKPGSASQVVCEAFHIVIKRSDIATLIGLNWLNDEVINFYMEMIRERGTRDNFPSVHCFNTFFYPKIMSSGQQAVKRWTKKVDIFEKDYLIIPVHLGMHWCLAMVDNRAKEIRYYDSMGGTNNKALHAIKKYLEDESLEKRKRAIDLQDWHLINVEDIPHQMNGSDCGMFTCKFAEFITRDAQITFCQDHMPYFRKRMIYEILTQKFYTG